MYPLVEVETQYVYPVQRQGIARRRGQAWGNDLSPTK